ncbi:MAG: ABC transporter permease subunit [Christensenellaceae bacterium]|jgi:ABC-2 type transport system permease protein|nr:ABC transporter permease subunit [Christensenellaceae bacterium]
MHNKILSKHILRQSAKGNWKLWTILTGILCFFMVVMAVFAARDVPNHNGRPVMTLLDLYGQMLSNMNIMLIIFAVVVGNKLVVNEIDRGTMSFTLNTPTTRKQIIFSKALFYAGAILAMVVMVGLFGLISGAATGKELPFGRFVAMLLGLFLYAFAISGITFFASCWFNKSGYSMIISAGVPVAFTVFDMLSNIKEFKFLRNLSLNTLFNTGKIIALDNIFWAQFVAMFVIGATLYTIGIIKFLKKDLPL